MITILDAVEIKTSPENIFSLISMKTLWIGIVTKLDDGVLKITHLKKAQS